MNLRLNGGARSNERTTNNVVSSAESGVNMAVIIGKDKRSTFYDRSEAQFSKGGDRESGE